MLKKRVKQILTMALAITISIASPLTSINVSASGSAMGDNTGGGTGNMGYSSDYKAWRASEQGYRIFVVNANLERVSGVHDYLFSNPVAGEALHNTRFDSANSPDNWSINSIQDLADLTNSSVSEVPYPVKNNQGHGEELKNWLLKNMPASNGNNGGNIYSGGTPSSSGSTSSGSTSTSSGSGVVPGDPESYPTIASERINLGKLVSQNSVATAYGKLTATEKTEITKLLNNAKLFYTVAYKSSLTGYSYLSTEEREYYSLGALYNSLSNYNLSYNQKIYACACVYQCKKSIAAEISSSAKLNSQSLLNQIIPLAGEESVPEAPIILLLEDTNAIQVPGYTSAMRALMDNHYLVIEPICWIYIQTSNGSYEAQKTYGSYWNLANKWLEKGGSANGAFYSSYMKKLGNNCLTVNSSVTTATGAVLNAASIETRTVSQSVADMQNSGLSMHLYSSLDLTPTVPEPEKIEISGDWVLNESEISKPVTTSTKTSNQIMKYSLGSLEKCDTDHLDCEHSCNNDCEGGDLDCDSKDPKHEHNDSCYTNEYCGHSHNSSCYKKCDSYSLHDKGLSFTLKNTKENDFPSLLASSLGTRNNTISKDRTKTGAETVEASGFTYDFLIFRGADKLNFASYVNNINILGFSSLNSKSAVTRKTADYQESISINLTDASSDLDTSANGNRHGDGLFTDTASPLTTIGYTGTVAIKTYSGKQRAINTTVNDNPLMRLTNVSGDNTAGRQVDSKSQIVFNPYIKMTYAELDNVKHEVNVLGEYQRTICPDDYAEIQWTYEPENLKVQSQMWALDRMYTDKNDGLDWTDTNQVLKGGSTYSLVTDKKVVSLNTYQTLVGDSSRAISSISGDYNLSEAEAVEAHNIFVQGALAKFDSTEVIQYVSTNLNDKNAWEDGIAVYAGANIRDLDNGSKTASEESKYYLRSDVNNVTNISRNDLDVRELGTTKKFYRFYSDTNGRIFMVEGDSISAVESGAGSQILDKTQGVSSLSGTAQFLDNRTLVVTKLLAALERNTGNDVTASWAPDGKWYNEAYSGIIIMVQRTGVEIKFDKTNTRTTVLDPKLVPNINSKYTQVKKESLTAFMSQYCTNLSENEPISTFKGQQVFMYKPNELFNSNKFYIPPMTVQD